MDLLSIHTVILIVIKVLYCIVEEASHRLSGYCVNHGGSRRRDFCQLSSQLPVQLSTYLPEDNNLILQLLYKLYKV